MILNGTHCWVGSKNAANVADKFGGISVKKIVHEGWVGVI